MSRHDVVITVAGTMGGALREEFGDLDVVVDRGVTRLHVVDADASVVHGVLRRIEALGLELLDVHREEGPRG